MHNVYKTFSIKSVPQLSSGKHFTGALNEISHIFRRKDKKIESSTDREVFISSV